MRIKDMINILLFEDNPGDVRLIKEYLKESATVAFYMENVENLKTGLDVLNHNLPDVILIDLGLPDSQGLETFLQIHAVAPEVPIVVLTGLNDADQAVDAVKAGAQDYLVKGEISGGLLIRAIRYAVERKQAEQDLQDSEKHLQFISDHAPVFIAQCDTDQRYKFVNQPYADMFGFQPSDIIGRLARDILDKETYEKARPYMEMALAGQVTEYELKLTTINGETRILHVSYAPERDSADQVTGFVAAITDITELKRVDEELRESNEFNVSLLKTIPLGMDIVDEHGHLLFLSPALEKEVGADKLGQRCWELYKDDKQQCKDCPLKKNINPGETNIMETSGALNGRFFEISHTGMIFKGKKAILEVFHDITLRKQAEQEVLHRLGELEVIYASSLALSQLNEPKEIGRKVIELFADRLHWHHSAIHKYHPENDSFELLAFHKAGLNTKEELLAAEKLYYNKVRQAGTSFPRWVIEHGQLVYCGDVANDERYIEIWPEIQAVITAPMKVGDRTIGCFSVSSNVKHPFTETDEWLISTLATQVASALENTRLIMETRQRLAESEMVNKISIALRSAESLDIILPVFLDETLSLLDTHAGAIWLYDPDCEELHLAVSRGWLNNLSMKLVKPAEGFLGTTFTTGKTLFSSKFLNDASNLDDDLRNIPDGWEGICVPIQSAQSVVGVMLILVNQPDQLSTGKIQALNTLTEILGIAIQRIRLHDQTRQQLKHLQVLHEIDTVIAASFDLNFTLDTFLKYVLSQLQIDAASIFILNSHSRTLDYTIGKGFRLPVTENKHLNFNQGYAGRVAFERRNIYYKNLPSDNNLPSYTNMINKEGFISYYGVPLIVKGEVKGVLEIFKRSPLKLSAEWLDLLAAMTGQAAIAIDSNLTYDNLQRSNMELVMTYDKTIEGWSNALDMRDKETEGHSERVTEMTLMLARILVIKDEEIVHIRRGALLHDIGKMGIPDSILLKPGPLNEEEWGVMRTHPFRAYELLAPIPYLRPALDIPYCHHEKWDGTGYPRGLKGEEIPISARIFAAVDVYDALTSDRPYRIAWTREKALEYIKSESGKQFDPKVVDTFLKMKNSE